MKVSAQDDSTLVFDAIATNVADKKEDAVISRMVAALRLREITDSKKGQELAIKYQLVSRWTNYLAIVEREEGDKAETLPELHKVQQMLAAGYGGIGSVMYCASQPVTVLENTIKYSRAKFCLAPAPAPASDSYDMPSFMRRSADSEPSDVRKFSNSLSLIDQDDSVGSYLQDDAQWLWEKNRTDKIEDFIQLLETTLRTGTMPKTIHLPLLPAEIKTVLALLVDEGIDEITVVTVFLHHLAESVAGNRLSRQAKRVISKEYKELKVDSQLIESIRERLKIGIIESLFGEDQYDVPTFLRKVGNLGAIS